MNKQTEIAYVTFSYCYNHGHNVEQMPVNPQVWFVDNRCKKKRESVILMCGKINSDTILSKSLRFSS